MFHHIFYFAWGLCSIHLESIHQFIKLVTLNLFFFLIKCILFNETWATRRCIMSTGMSFFKTAEEALICPMSPRPWLSEWRKQVNGQ